MRKDSNKVLVISAFSCAPDWGSEAEVGWRAVDYVRGTELTAHVFVDSGYRKAFSEELLRELKQDGVELHFRGLGRGVSKLFGGGNLGRTCYYSVWQKKLPKWVEEVCRREEIGLVHHVTWAKYSIPSDLWKLGVPFFFGPVGGGETAPPGLVKELPIKPRVFESLRSGVQALNQSLGISRAAFQNARHTWASTEETKDAVLKICPEAKVTVQNQVCINEICKTGKWSNRGRVISVGRFIDWKGFWLVLDAFFAAGDEVNELVLVGTGPAEKALRKQAAALSRPNKKVEFRGWLDSGEVVAELEKAGQFCFGSLHDSGGFAVLEALATGLPVVCLKAGGPATVVTPACGRLVQPTNPERTRRGLTEGMEYFAGLSKDEWEQVSLAAKDRAKEYHPDQLRVERLRFYRTVLQEKESASDMRNQ